MPDQTTRSDNSPSVEELRAERDWLLHELDLARKSLVEEQEAQYAAYRQLVELERVRAFDEIARGIAHSLFNKLTPIEGFAELMIDDTTQSLSRDQMKEYLQIILNATREAKGVIDEMRDLYYSTDKVDFEQHQSVTEMLSHALTKEAIEEDSEEEEDFEQHMATEALSPREWDVLRLLSDGLSNRDIAETLKVSENTVKTHIKAILSKLSLKNRTQAAAYALLDQQAFDEMATDGRQRNSA